MRCGSRHVLVLFQERQEDEAILNPNDRKYLNDLGFPT